MQTVTLSPKYQLVIPKNIRDALKPRPGRKMTVTGYAGRIESMPDCDISDTLIFPAISIFEVFKVVIRETDENKSLLAIAAMQKGSVLVLNAKIAMDASLLSIQHHLPMADSIILATARADN